MFLRVTDFYSLEKIISAFPKIMLLYLKWLESEKERWGTWEKGFVQWKREGGGTKDFVSL